MCDCEHNCDDEGGQRSLRTIHLTSGLAEYSVKSAHLCRIGRSNAMKHMDVREWPSANSALFPCLQLNQRQSEQLFPRIYCLDEKAFGLAEGFLF